MIGSLKPKSTSNSRGSFTFESKFVLSKIQVIGFILFIASSCSSFDALDQKTVYMGRGIYLSDYIQGTSQSNARLLQELVIKASRTNSDLYIDTDVVLDKSIVISNVSDLVIRFVNGAKLVQIGIPLGQQSQEVGSRFFDAIKIIDSQNVQIFDAKIVGENPDGFILGLGNEAAAVSIESSGYDEYGMALTRNIFFFRPEIQKIIGSGVRSFAGQKVSNVHITEGVFSDLAKTAVNCCVESLFVTNCLMTRCRSGLEIASSSHCIISNNKITFCDHSGIAIGGYNKSSTKRDGSLPFELEEMRVQSERQLAVKVINNFIYKCGAGLDFKSSNGPGISVTVGTTYPVISNNHVYYSGRSGIQVAQAPLASNPVLLPLIHDNILVANGHRNNTGPNAGIYADCPIIAHDNLIDNRSSNSEFVPSNGIYISLRYYRRNTYLDANHLSIYNNQIVNDEKTAIAVYLKDGTKDFRMQNRILN